MRLKNKFLLYLFVFCSALSIFQNIKSVGDDNNPSLSGNIVAAEERVLVLERDSSGNLFLPVPESVVKGDRDYTARPGDYKINDSNSKIDQDLFDRVANSEVSKSIHETFNNDDDNHRQNLMDAAEGIAIGTVAQGLVQAAAPYLFVAAEVAATAGTAATVAAPTAPATLGSGPVIAGLVAGGYVVLKNISREKSNADFLNVSLNRSSENQTTYFPIELTTKEIYGTDEVQYREIKPLSVVQKINDDGSIKYLIPISKEDLSGDVVSYYLPNTKPLINKLESFASNDVNTNIPLQNTERSKSTNVSDALKLMSNALIDFEKKVNDKFNINPMPTTLDGVNIESHTVPMEVDTSEKNKANIVEATNKSVKNLEFVNTGIEAEKQLEKPESVDTILSDLEVKVNTGGSNISRNHKQSLIDVAAKKVRDRSAYDWSVLAQQNGFYCPVAVTKYDLWQYPEFLEFLKQDFYDAFKEKIIYFKHNAKELERAFRDKTDTIGDFKTRRASTKKLKKWHVPGIVAEIIGDGYGVVAGDSGDDNAAEDYVNQQYNEIMEKDHPFTLLEEKLTEDQNKLRERYKFDGSEFLRILRNQINRFNDLSTEDRDRLNYVLEEAIKSSLLGSMEKRTIFEFKNIVSTKFDDLQKQYLDNLRRQEIQRQRDIFHHNREGLRRRNYTIPKDKDVSSKKFCVNPKLEILKKSNFRQEISRDIRNRIFEKIKTREERRNISESALINAAENYNLDGAKEGSKLENKDSISSSNVRSNLKRRTRFIGSNVPGIGEIEDVELDGVEVKKEEKPVDLSREKKNYSGDSTLKQTGKIIGGIAYNVGVEALAQTGSVLAQQEANRFLNGGEDIVPVDPFRNVRMPFDGQTHDPVLSQITSPFDQCKDPFSSVRNPFGAFEYSQDSQFLNNLKKEAIERNTYKPKLGVQKPKRKLAGLIFKGEKFKDLGTITTNTEPRKTSKRKHKEEVAGQTGQPNQEPPKKPKKDDDKNSDNDDPSEQSGTGNLFDLYKKISVGKGSTGRRIPKTLNEQLAMKEVLHNPLSDAKELKNITMTDSRWLSKDGWVKMSKNINDIEIHYVWNKILNVFDDFKFK